MTKRTPRIHLPTPSRLYGLDQMYEPVAVLRSLDQFQGLTSWQVGRLHFHNRPNLRRGRRDPKAAQQAANKLCLQRLKANGYVAVAPYLIRNRGNKDHWDRYEANVLTDDGRLTLANNLPGYRPASGHLTPETVEQFAAHEHLTNEIGVALAANAAWAGYTLVDWQAEQLLRSRSLQRTPGNLLRGVIPDAFFRLERDGATWPFFLEFDNKTEDLDSGKPNSIRTKLLNYGDYFRARYLDDRALHGTCGPRLLFVTTSPARLDTMVELAEGLGCRNVYWFALLDYFLLKQDPTDGEWLAYEPIGSIWRKSGTAGHVSLFDADARSPLKGLSPN